MCSSIIPIVLFILLSLPSYSYSDNSDELLKETTSWYDSQMVHHFYNSSNELTPLQEALLAAATYGKTDFVRKLLDHGVVFDWKLKPFQKAWIEIILNRRVTVAGLLLKAGMNINAIDLGDINGRSALMEAVVTDLPTVEFFLSKGAKVDLEDKNGETALFHALWRKDNKDIVSRLIKAGADVNHINHNKETPLLRAIERNNVDAVKILLDAGADIEYRNRPRETPLILASGRGFDGIVQLLLDHGAKINGTEMFGSTALIAAAQEGQEAVFKLLLSKGANPEMTMLNGWNAMKAAVQKGNGQIVQLLLQQTKVMPSKEILDQMKQAIRAGNVDVLEAFLKNGYDVNSKDEYGDSLLNIASGEGQAAAVQILLGHKANIEAVNDRGEKAVDRAIWKNSVEILKLLLDHGAAKPTMKINGEPVLNQAVADVPYDGSFDMVRLLVDMGYDINQQDSQGQTPLLIAVGNYNDSNENLVTFLIEHNADIGAMEGGDKCSQVSKVPVPVAPSQMNMAMRIAGQPYVPQCVTPLMVAAKAGHLKIVQILLEHKANINTQSPVNGTSALMQAAELGDPQIVRYLLEHGADITLKDKNGQSALAIAEQKENTKAAAILREGTHQS